MDAHITTPYLGWKDFCQLFSCGRSKALLLMHAVGVIYVGRTAFVPTEALNRYLAEHGSIDPRWPKRTGSRR